MINETRKASLCIPDMIAPVIVINASNDTRTFLLYNECACYNVRIIWRQTCFRSIRPACGLNWLWNWPSSGGAGGTSFMYTSPRSLLCSSGDCQTDYDRLTDWLTEWLTLYMYILYVLYLQLVPPTPGHAFNHRESSISAGLTAAIRLQLCRGLVESRIDGFLSHSFGWVDQTYCTVSIDERFYRFSAAYACTVSGVQLSAAIKQHMSTLLHNQTNNRVTYIIYCPSCH